MSKYYLTQEDYLMHHGVKGQKWGQRQYQNEDGSLTALGREHYGYGKGIIRNTIQMNKDRYRYEKKYREDLKKAKKDRKARDKAIQEKYFKEMEKIEKGYKRGQMLSDKDQKRELDLDNKTRKEWADSKTAYKKAKINAKRNYTKNYDRLARDFYSNSKYSDFGKLAVAGVAAYGVGKLLEKNADTMGKAIAVGILEGAGEGLVLGAGLNAVGKAAIKKTNRNIYA